MTDPAKTNFLNTEADAPPGAVYLRAFLEPLAPLLERDDVSEILCNRPGEIWVEEAGASEMRCLSNPALTERHIERLATQIARINHQAINPDYPLLAATLPGGERVQIVGPTATRAHWALAIRKQVTRDLTLSDFAPDGGISALRGLQSASGRVNEQLKELRASGDIKQFFQLAVRARKTMLVSGGTSAGKTSLLNALLKEIPNGERIIAVEDTAEIRPSQPNFVGLVSAKGELGRARIDVNDLLQAALRMRPDRILVGEVRGAEAITFLRAINTGHPGSITTVHADTPRGALEQIALMVLQGGLALNREDTIAYIRSIIDIIVQVERKDGRRQISDIYFEPKED